jgi:hypothetical protein
MRPGSSGFGNARALGLADAARSDQSNAGIADIFGGGYGMHVHQHRRSGLGAVETSGTEQ